jgi:RNA polymerase sigma-70 factor (ECF subfamily)
MVERSDEQALTDQELLGRIAGEDRHAFTILMQRHGQRVRGVALGFCGRAADADDIVQEVFLTLWRRPKAWQSGKAAFSTWLYRVVANRCLDLARRQRIRQWLPLGGAIDTRDEMPDAFGVVASKSKLASVRKMIRALPDRQRLALLLSIQGDRSNAEIADILGTSEGAAEQLLVRARRSLHTSISKQEAVE